MLHADSKASAETGLMPRLTYFPPETSGSKGELIVYPSDS